MSSRGVVRRAFRGGALLLVLGATYLMHLYLWAWERIKKRTIFAVY